jgi:hypothetical protein
MMGSSFDDLLGQYEPPTDYDIVLPGKVGPAGNKGGNNAASTPAAVTAPGTPADSHPAGTSQEPAPELPEGSDEDEVAAAAEEEQAAQQEQERQAQRAAEEAEAETTTEEEAGNTTGTDPTSSDPDSVQPESVPGLQAAPYPVIPRKGGGLSFEGESAYLKQFPRILIDQMREILKPHLGDVFARDLSQVSIVTAFVIASLGAEIATDESTAEAVKAFRANDPKTDAIEKRTAALLEQQAKIEGSLKKISEKLGEVADTTAVLEMGQAYALAERTALLDTDGVLPETIDVTQKRAVASRDNIRKRVKTHQTEEKVRAGRPIR